MIGMGAFQDGSARIQTQLLQIQPRSWPLMMSLKRLKLRHRDMRLLLKVVPISLTLPVISPCCDPGVLLVGILYITTNLCIPTLHCQTPSLVCLSCSYGGSTLSLGVPPSPLAAEVSWSSAPSIQEEEEEFRQNIKGIQSP